MSEETDEIAGTNLPVAPGLVRTAVLAQLDELAPFVEGLTDEQWKQPSAAAGWSIGDVVTHLDLAMGLYTGLLDVSGRGWGGGSAWKAFGQMTEKIGPRATGAFNAVNSAVPRMISGAVTAGTVKGQFVSGAARLHSRLEALEPAHFTRPIHYMGRPWPLSFFLSAVTNELAIHGWDMRSRLTSDAHLDAEARAVLPWFYWGGTSFMCRPPAGIEGTIQVLLRDPATALYWTLAAGKATGQMGEAPAADATIEGEAGTVVLALAGRIGAHDALLTTSLTAQGDGTLARAFLSAWSIAPSR